MKLINILLMGILVFNFACGLQSDEKQGTVPPSERKLVEQVALTPLGDFDGDSITNEKEKELGRNPFVAEVPELKVRFLHNYSIKFTAQFAEGFAAGRESMFEINTSVGRDDPDFKYRVGDIFARHNTYKVLANVGRFFGHHWGDINDHDFSWVKYPSIDPAFFHQMMIEARPYVRTPEFKIKDITIDLENTVKLKQNSYFKEIKNLEVSFYFYNYETENYELIKREIVERHFNAGVTETFKIKIEDAPVNLLRDNYLSKGEFVISEITNYEIPELETDYKTYIAKIKQKSIPVVVNTPMETSLFYVGVNGKSDSFIGILEHLFPKMVKVKENKLVKVKQFENNLGNYTYLKEIRDKDKNGQWFVLTNKLTQHYLDHGYTINDRIILSYITGQELATQKDEIISSLKRGASGGDDFELYPIGNISPNSQVDIQLKPLTRSGQSWERKTEILDVPKHSCGTNCMNLGIYCRWEINVVKDYEEGFSFDKTLRGDTSLIELVINDTAYSLSTLLAQEKISIRWQKNGNMHISIKDIEKIQELNNFDTNLVQLKIVTRKKNDFWGAKLINVGRFWQGMNGCGYNTPAVASKFGTRYISKESIHFNEIQTAYDHALNDAGRKHYILKNAGLMYQRISTRISSTITNYFN